MKKHILMAALSLCLLLTMGCGKTPQDSSGDTEKSAGGTQTAITALDRLQSGIAEKDCMLGVAFFGYVDSESDEAAVRAFAAGSSLVRDYPFLADCTPVLTEGAELYALVPANKDTAVTVCPAEMSEDGNYIDRKDTPLYTGKPGEAVILRCNLSEIHANVRISATDGSSTLEFHPMISLENGRMVQEEGCYDFSVYQQDPVEAARERLLAADEVQDALQRGMKLLYTGDSQTIDGQDCPVFALGTDSAEQFVREQLYAVSDSRIYAYSVLSDSWEILGAG